MLRLIKADFYRLFHSKGFYMILLAIIGLAGSIIVSELFTAMSANEETYAAMDAYQNMGWDPAIALKGALSSSSMLNYLFIGFFIIISGYEFSQKMYKNTLTSGVSRITFVVSKYFTLLLTVMLGTALYLGSTFIFSFFKYGMSNVNLGELMKDTAFATISLAFCISVIFSLANVLLIAFTSSVLATVFIAVFPLAIQMITLATKWSGMKYFDFFSIGQDMALNELSGEALIPYILISLAMIIGSIIISAGVIKKKEF